MTIALLGDIFQQTPLGRPLNNSLNHLRAGHTLTESLSMENLIPKEWIGLMKASEYSHQLPDTFQHLSQIEQSLLQRKWNTVLKFIEPVCIFLLSIMIGGVIILLLYPILTLLDLENAL
jgi:type II secretory pathway component PulF